MKQKKRLALFCVLLVLLLLAGSAAGGHMRKRRQLEEAFQRKAELTREVEALLLEHGDLFENLAEVLVRQEEPLSIDWEQEPWEEGGAFLVHMEGSAVSPEILDEGFSEVLAELYQLVPSSISYRGADSALIQLTYASENLGSAMFEVVSIEYDGTAWSVCAAEYPGV